MIPVGSTHAGLADGIESRLTAAGCVAARDEAALLVREAPDRTTLERWVTARCDGTPVAWLIGWTDLGGVRVDIDPGVYVPRPHTAELARRAPDDHVAARVLLQILRPGLRNLGRRLAMGASFTDVDHEIPVPVHQGGVRLAGGPVAPDEVGPRGNGTGLPGPDR